MSVDVPVGDLGVASFVRRRLGEDEEAAWDCAGSTAHRFALQLGIPLWEARYIGHPKQMPEVWYRKSGGKVAGPTADEVAEHIARYDPTRVLREIEAKRAILELHQRVDHRPDPLGRDQANRWPEPACYGCGANFAEEYAVPNADDCPVVRLLAAVYADHPEYDRSWAPQGRQ